MKLRPTLNEAADGLLITPHMLEQARGNGYHMLVSISPRAFLTLTTESDSSITQIAKESHSVDQYNKWAQEGEISVIPNLNVDAQLGKVDGHEGRHRAAALINAGINEMIICIKLVDPGPVQKEKYGVWDAKYDMKFEDLPDNIIGQFGRGSVPKSSLRLIKDGRNSL